ncbi:MAG: DNA-formamidopyrimidine glycosylase family protein, partial [Alphaproteobacteria bacterium]
MPELPEVETVINGLKPAMLNKTIKSVETTRKNLRYDFPNNLDKITKGADILDMKRFSKYIVIRLSTGWSLISHLGMSGKYTVHSYERNEPVEIVKHDHIIFYMEDGGTIIYNDPRRFGFLIACKTDDEKNEKHLSKLGIDPTDKKLTADYIYNKFQKSKSNLKTALMNQSIISGLGNIYVCEAMYR